MNIRRVVLAISLGIAAWVLVVLAGETAVEARRGHASDEFTLFGGPVVALASSSWLPIVAGVTRLIALILAWRQKVSEMTFLAILACLAFGALWWNDVVEFFARQPGMLG